MRVLVTKLQIFLKCVAADTGTPVGLNRSGVLQEESVEETPVRRKALGAHQRSTDWTEMLDSSCRFGAGTIQRNCFLTVLVTGRLRPEGQFKCVVGTWG